MSAGEVTTVSDYPRSVRDPDAEDKAFWEEFERRFIHKFSEEDREEVYDEADKEWWFDALLTGLALAGPNNVKFPEEFIQRLEATYTGALMPMILAWLRENDLVVP